MLGEAEGGKSQAVLPQRPWDGWSGDSLRQTRPLKRQTAMDWSGRRLRRGSKQMQEGKE